MAVRKGIHISGTYVEHRKLYQYALFIYVLFIVKK